MLAIGQTTTTISRIGSASARIGGLAVLGAVVAGLVAMAYRWYTEESVSYVPPILLADAIVALYLNVSIVLGQIVGGSPVVSVRGALFNGGAIATTTIASAGSVMIGTQLAEAVLTAREPIPVSGEVGAFLETVGRVTTVDIPTEIADVSGYDPVDAETKSKLTGRTLVFPSGLGEDELRDRLARRLREDYQVGHVDVEIDGDGTITHLGLGKRAWGLGPTLPPESVAVVIRADPATATATGDVVQVWSRDSHERILNAEVRGTSGDVLTLAIDAAHASKLDPDERYKLVTLSASDRAHREITELLRAAEETIADITIQEGCTLVGVPIGALDVTVVAINSDSPDDQLDAIPPRNRVLESGDSVYVLARPDVIRQIERYARDSRPEPVSATPTEPSPEVEESTQPDIDETEREPPVSEEKPEAEVEAEGEPGAFEEGSEAEVEAESEPGAFEEGSEAEVEAESGPGAFEEGPESEVEAESEPGAFEEGSEAEVEAESEFGAFEEGPEAEVETESEFGAFEESAEEGESDTDVFEEATGDEGSESEAQDEEIEAFQADFDTDGEEPTQPDDDEEDWDAGIGDADQTDQATDEMTETESEESQEDEMSAFDAEFNADAGETTDSEFGEIEKDTADHMIADLQEDSDQESAETQSNSNGGEMESKGGFSELKEEFDQESEETLSRSAESETEPSDDTSETPEDESES